MNDKRLLDEPLNTHLRVQRADRILEHHLQIAPFGERSVLHPWLELGACVHNAPR